jgi:hypothetical protein
MIWTKFLNIIDMNDFAKVTAQLLCTETTWKTIGIFDKCFLLSSPVVKESVYVVRVFQEKVIIHQTWHRIS